jgi:hypothetical protein
MCPVSKPSIIPSLDDLGHQTGSHSPAALADVETLARFDCDGVVELADHLDVVTGHNHLRLFVRCSVWPV